MAAGYFGIATVLADLAGTWAVDPLYGEKIAGRLNLMVTAGLLPAPKRRGKKWQRTATS
jgi:hypothetical protein